MPDWSVEMIARTIGMQHTAAEILTATAEVSRRVLGVDSSFVAVTKAQGEYAISVTDGIRAPRFRDIVVRPGVGLGGQVLLLSNPQRVDDYACDPVISRDFVHVVCDLEGLRGMACVPVTGPGGVEALLYTATRTVIHPSDRTLQTMELVATQAVVAMQQAAIRDQETALAALQERQKLATELHDSVAQTLFAIGIATHRAQGCQDPAALAAVLGEIDGMAADARREIRATVDRLSRPAAGLAFETRLAGEIQLFARSTGCLVRIVHRGERRDLPQPVEDLVVDTAAEGLRNAVKHAGARLGIVHLAYRPDDVVLVVQAESAGGSGAASAGCGSGTGLALLRRRAAGLRGVLELTGEPPDLKVLRLKVPARHP